MENLKQSLLEHIADWLDLESTELDMLIHGLKDNEDLHIKMCEAAFKVFEQEVNPELLNTNN